MVGRWPEPTLLVIPLQCVPHCPDQMLAGFRSIALDSLGNPQAFAAGAIYGHPLEGDTVSAEKADEAAAGPVGQPEPVQPCRLSVHGQCFETNRHRPLPGYRLGRLRESGLYFQDRRPWAESTRGRKRLVGTRAVGYEGKQEIVARLNNGSIRLPNGEFYDFFFNRFGRDSYDGAGGALISTVRYCGGSCANSNAYWNGFQTVYWPGMAVDDVIGHEFAHALTEHTSNLLYYHQSGAINEALSDVFGELIDLTNGSAADTPATRWLMGETSVLGAIRDMEDPTLGNDPVYSQPDRMRSSLYWAQESDNYGVHVNSGIANKAAFRMVDGGAYHGQTVSGMPGHPPIHRRQRHAGQLGDVFPPAALSHPQHDPRPRTDRSRHLSAVDQRPKLHPLIRCQLHEAQPTTPTSRQDNRITRH